MIISERQILQLIRIAEAFCSAMHRLGEYRNVEAVHNLLVTISDQQSDKLKEVE